MQAFSCRVIPGLPLKISMWQTTFSVLTHAVPLLDELSNIAALHHPSPSAVVREIQKTDSQVPGYDCTAAITQATDRWLCLVQQPHPTHPASTPCGTCAESKYALGQSYALLYSKLGEDAGTEYYENDYTNTEMSGNSKAGLTQIMQMAKAQREAERVCSVSTAGSSTNIEPLSLPDT
jgi:hypothetical protein